MNISSQQDRLYIGWIAATILVICMAFAQPAQALTTICVSNSTELRAALASTTADTVDIRVRSGSYLTGGNYFSWSAFDTHIRSMSGGWTGAAGQCTSQTPNPALTLFDAQGSGYVLRMGQFSGASSGSLFLSNLSLTGGNLASSSAGCLLVYMSLGNPTVLIDRVVIRGCQHTGGFGTGAVAIESFTGANITMRNSLIADNQGAWTGGVTVSSNHVDARLFLHNNTIVDNIATTDARGGGFAPFSTMIGIVTLNNNAILGNLSAGNARDLYFGGGPSSSHVLRNNATQVIIGESWTQSSGTLITTTPGFVSAGNNFRIAAGSPLRNAGIALTTPEIGTRDLDFGLRVQGGSIDIGAYEYDGLFANSFE